MDHYLNYTADDFVQDEAFIEWVKAPTSESTKLWETWLSRYPEKATLIKQSKDIIQAFDFAPAAVDESFYLQLRNRINRTLSEKRSSTVRRMMPSIVWLKVAAVLMGLLVVGGIFYAISKPTQYIALQSGNAEIRTTTLPDGSAVTLNANSKLRYAKNWDNHNREVWMEGEGFFSVKHLENSGEAPLPFVVHAGNSNVEVLGTEFNVKDRSEGTEVVLAKGKVQFTVDETNIAPLVLKPNQLAIFKKGAKTITASPMDASQYTAWRVHKAILDKQPLREICNTLQHYYGMPFLIEDPVMASQQLSGTLELQNEEAVLQTLSLLLETRVGKERGQVIIHSKQ